MSIKHATFIPFGEVQGTALTGVYQLLCAPGNDLCSVYILNSCDKPLIVSFDGGVTGHFKLDTDYFLFDGITNSKHIKNPTIMVKHAGIVSTVGSVRASGIYAF